MAPDRAHSQEILASHLDRLLSLREYPKTICPSEVPRALTPAELTALGCSDWRDLMPEVREMLQDRRQNVRVEVLQKGSLVPGDVEDRRHGFLLRPMEITKKVIDFKKTDLPEYEGLYAVVLDNCFTEAECQTLIEMAEQSAGGVWQEAMINAGGGRQITAKDTRDCGRIIWDDADMVDRIWKRVVDHVPEIMKLKDKPRILGNGPTKWEETVQMTRLNERMRFLKYGEGQYFRPHMDGCYVTPDQHEISFFTLHLYLNDNPDGGGATTFHSLNMEREFDVEPKPGRALIFQHRNLLHSGADVTSGTKYTLRTDLMYKKVGLETTKWGAST